MIIIGMISIIIYTIAILIVSSNTYEFEKEKKLKFIVIGIFIILVITWIIVLISSSGIQVENKQYLKTTRTASVLIFSPINTIFGLPYLGAIMNKYKQKRLQNEQVKKRLIIYLIILFIITILEINYIKSFQIGLLSNVIK